MVIEYYKVLHNNPSISLRTLLPIIKMAEERGDGAFMEFAPKDFGVETSDYTITFTTISISLKDGKIKLCFKWNFQDSNKTTSHTQNIDVIAEKSNLVASSKVYYFLCPVMHLKSRKLFCISNVWVCRRAFPHRYAHQNESHNQRLIQYNKEPYRKYGKTHYRGKLTPYGKRCKKYEFREELTAAAILYSLDNKKKSFNKLKKLWH